MRPQQNVENADTGGALNHCPYFSITDHSYHNNEIFTDLFRSSLRIFSQGRRNVGAQRCHASRVASWCIGLFCVSGVCLRPQVARLSGSQATEEEIVDDLRQLLVKFKSLRHPKCCPFSQTGLCILNRLDKGLYTRVAEHHGWPSFDEKGRAQLDGSAACQGAFRLNTAEKLYNHARDIGKKAKTWLPRAQPSGPSPSPVEDDDESDVDDEYVRNVLAHVLWCEVLDEQQ